MGDQIQLFKWLLEDKIKLPDTYDKLTSTLHHHLLGERKLASTPGASFPKEPFQIHNVCPRLDESKSNQANMEEEQTVLTEAIKMVSATEVVENKVQ